MAKAMVKTARKSGSGNGRPLMESTLPVRVQAAYDEVQAAGEAMKASRQRVQDAEAGMWSLVGESRQVARELADAVI